jgi:hypothetical protein
MPRMDQGPGKAKLFRSNSEEKSIATPTELLSISPSVTRAAPN